MISKSMSDGESSTLSETQTTLLDDQRNQISLSLSLILSQSIISLKNVLKWLIYTLYCIKHILKATKCFTVITDIQAIMKRTNNKKRIKQWTNVGLNSLTCSIDYNTIGIIIR